MERIQKVIAQSGYCSRRKAEELIAAGKVKVNGERAQIGMKVSGLDQITVNGMRLSKEEKTYYVLNKPKGCISSVKDEHGRKTVIDYVPKEHRVFPVGRLDYDTSGVLILTNDGDFANKMIHPRHHIPKTYEINLQGILSDEDIRKIRKGFTYNDQTYAPAKVFVKSVDNTRERSLVDLTIYEGQNHQVKNMMEALGHQVRRLNRSRFGFVTAQGLRPGEYRKLKMFDVKKLVRMSEEEEQ
jgi:23S rRNA pseudouridine2605 synthase